MSEPASEISGSTIPTSDPQFDALAASVKVPASTEGWNFGLPQLFLLVLASAVLFGSSRVFGWEHLLCNGPLFLVVAALAKGRRVEALCVQVLLFSAILWILSLVGFSM